MNREQKRMLQRQGQVGPDGSPVAATRPTQPRSLSGRAPSSPRMTPFGYFREVRNELKKVAWPTRTEVRKYSIVVLITLAVLITMITVLDFLFTEAAIFLFK